MRHSAMLQALALTLALLSPGLEASRRKPWPDAASFPDPSRDSEGLCGRAGVVSRICDPDGILTKEGADVTEGVLNLIAAGEPPYVKAPCHTPQLQGYEVGVALLQKLERPPGTEDAAAVEKFAHELHAKWGVGGSSCQTGVLLVVALKNRQLYISTGEGAKQKLSWDTLGAIIDHAKPLLKDKRYDDAVQQTVVNIGLALAGKAITPAKEQSDWWGILVVGGVLATIIGAACLGERQHVRARGRFRDCKALLERIKRDQVALQSGRYEVTSCPICLEEFLPESSEGPGGAGSQQEGPSAGSKAKGDVETEPLLARDAAAAAAAATVPSASSAPAAAAAAALPGSGGTAATGNPHLSRRAMAVKCGHVFCEACLTQWVEQQRKLSCPICRRDLDTGDEQPSQRRPPSDAYQPPGPPCSDEAETDTTQRTFQEQQAAWEQEFPEAVLPGVAPRVRTHAPSEPRLRLYGARRGSWRYRGVSGYRLDDLTRGGLTQEEARQLFLSDLMFRLASLRRRYPEYVTDGMARTWLQDVQHGRSLSAEQLRELQVNDPDVRRALARQGAHGSGSSGWGGGSGGGSSSGGRGGSW